MFLLFLINFVVVVIVVVEIVSILFNIWFVIMVVLGSDGYVNGGYIGYGGKYELVGVVYKGEGVLI